MTLLHNLFQTSPEAALFLSLTLGYAIGAIPLGRFQLGGVGGTLVAAVILSQAGVDISTSLKSVTFALFIYAVGYVSGPQFFNALNRSALKEIAMSVFIAATGLVTVVVLARLFHLDKGIAAGLAAGGLTQSAIIGTAGDALSRLSLPAAEITQLQTNVAVGYAVTYIFGTLGAIIVCAGWLPRLMSADLRNEAKRAEAELGSPPSLSVDQRFAFPSLMSRVYQVTTAAGESVADIERRLRGDGSVEAVLRGATSVAVKPELRLEKADKVALAGRRVAVASGTSVIGPEVVNPVGLNTVMETRDVVFTHRGIKNKTIAELRDMIDPQTRHGVYIAGIRRVERPVPVLPGQVLHHGDVLQFYGAAEDVSRVARLVGYEVVPNDRTDFIYLGLGIFVGILIGMVTVRLGVPLSLGTGGGALLSGLVFGWARAKHPTFGALPSAAAQILRDFGLAAFIAVVGLQAGRQALITIEHSGILIFALGLVVTFLPLLLAYAFGRYVLRYTNAAVLAGALAGARSSNPAFGAVLDKAESSVPTVPFAITYAIANVLLTILGPVIVALT
jgi:putative transport protein